MKKIVITALLLATSTGGAQEQANHSRTVKPWTPKLASEIPGINKEWVREMQRRTREYWAKRSNPAVHKDTSVGVPLSPVASTQAVTKAIPTANRVYEIPFASTNNTLELTVENASYLAARDVSVRAAETPGWLSLSPTTCNLGPLEAHGQTTAVITLSVERTAPIGTEQTVKLNILAGRQSWTKEITIKVSPPERFEVLQNYPNPFNPTTTVSYDLPDQSRVTVRIYNMLGQEVATLFDGEQQAGYHQKVFDASRCASGVYIYRVVALNPSGNKTTGQKRMLLVK